MQPSITDYFFLFQPTVILSLNFLDTENSQRIPSNIIVLRNFKTLGCRGNEITLNITFAETVPLWNFS